MWKHWGDLSCLHGIIPMSFQLLFQSDILESTWLFSSLFWVSIFSMTAFCFAWWGNSRATCHGVAAPNTGAHRSPIDSEHASGSVVTSHYPVTFRGPNFGYWIHAGFPFFCCSSLHVLIPFLFIVFFIFMIFYLFLLQSSVCLWFILHVGRSPSEVFSLLSPII